MLHTLPTALTRVCTVANGKGGAGKTSTACNLAGLSAAAGWRVLFIDLDPQGNAGRDFGYRSASTNEGDDGREIFDALISPRPLAPPLVNYRPNLDILPGGTALEELEDVLIGRARRRANEAPLVEALEPVASDYDLVVIDTPPTRPYLLNVALAATRWIVIPTRSDDASIDGLETLAAQIIKARDTNPDVEVLGAVLFDVESSATAIRRDAAEDIAAALGDAAPLFDSVIRHSTKAARQVRRKGLLVHELAEEAKNAEPYWKALKEGRRPNSIAGTAPSLAEDYFLLVHEILGRIDEKEQQESQEVTA